jgi:hypothetical protein
LRELFKPREKKDAQPREGEADHKEQHAQDNGRVPMPTPVLIGDVEIPETIDRAGSGHREAEQARNPSYERWQTRFAGLIFLATAVYAAVTFFQLRAMHRQADLMSEQLRSVNESSKQTERLIKANESLAEQNRELVTHAGEQAKAADKQAEASLAQAEAAKQSVAVGVSAARVAERTAQINQLGVRPYIGLQENTLSNFEAGKRPTAIFNFTNYGSTAATVTRIQGTALFSRTRLTALPPYNTDYASDLTIAPGKQLRMESFPIDTELTPDMVDDIRGFRSFVYGRWKIDYQDGVGKKYSFDFCGFYDPTSGNFTYCQELPNQQQREKKKP